MSLETAIHAALAGDATLAALVAARVHPVIAPQDSPRPFIVYQRLNSQPFSPMTGPADLWRARVQLVVAADSFEAARAVAAAAKAAMEGLTSTSGVEAARVLAESEGYAADAEFVLRTVEVSILYQE
jgi:hypothetical protein